jgi:hypothetical protein
MGYIACRQKYAAPSLATSVASPNRPWSCLAVYSALSSSSSSSNQPSVLETAIYLGIQQHMEAPELTNPPRMPQCISSSKVSKQLTAAINAKYAAQLTMNASVDTTYIQVRLGLCVSHTQQVQCDREHASKAPQVAQVVCEG